MTRITIISKIRFLAGVAPVILLIVSPLLASAVIQLGNVPYDIRDEQVAAIKDAEGLDAALFKMEWGRLQPDGTQIVLDQQRRFANYLESAVHVATTPEQRDRINAIVEAAQPRLDAFRHADPHDEEMNKKMRDLHMLVNDLESADDAALDQYADDVSRHAREMAALIIVAGILIPMTCFGILWWMSRGVRSDLRAMREELQSLEDNPAVKESSIARVVEKIDASLARQGFPKPNPMLAE